MMLQRDFELAHRALKISLVHGVVFAVVFKQGQNRNKQEVQSQLKHDRPPYTF